MGLRAIPSAANVNEEAHMDKRAAHYLSTCTLRRAWDEAAHKKKQKKKTAFDRWGRETPPSPQLSSARSGRACSYTPRFSQKALKENAERDLTSHDV